ncbi:MAG: ATP synthase subunit I [Candidatus Chlorobium antarcticum]|nr:ATP synthase subunit I [Candidatus Chlorobium antarcticum]
MSIEISYLFLAFAGGVLLGILFYGGLWYTIQKGLTARRPWIWFTLSFLLRNTLALGGFYLLAVNDWQRFIAALVGFTAAKVFSGVFAQKGEN